MESHAETSNWGGRRRGAGRKPNPNRPKTVAKPRQSKPNEEGGWIEHEGQRIYLKRRIKGKHPIGYDPSLVTHRCCPMCERILSTAEYGPDSRAYCSQCSVARYRTGKPQEHWEAVEARRARDAAERADVDRRKAERRAEKLRRWTETQHRIAARNEATLARRKAELAHKALLAELRKSDRAARERAVEAARIASQAEAGLQRLEQVIDKDIRARDKERLRRMREGEKHHAHVLAWRKSLRRSFLSTRSDIRNNLRMTFKGWVRKRIRHAVPDGFQWEKMFPYSPDDVADHLERNFVEGMGWHNRTDWHIDHIKPISSFGIQHWDSAEFRECFALENLRPLWATDNIRKGPRLCSDHDTTFRM